ncbi:MAG: chorismate mutase [Candidatus Marinimicrobia bacterium]|nr:chorismate mutase [Candidatus Neomarinimicrobiota bacterium]|tara:strand:+ start:10066 stop:10356 length:291 start_codon:yes stop_codon:yes gene_type:complete
MSLSKNKNIIKIRKKLDALDNRLLNLIKKRTYLVNKVLLNKSSKNQIIDNKRIKIILKNIKKKSIQKKIDTRLTQLIWKNMIKAYIDFEYRKFKKK